MKWKKKMKRGEESEEKDEYDMLKENMVIYDDNLIVKM